MTEGQVAPKPRSKRLYVYWGVALALLLAAGLFSWLVVVPYLRVRQVAMELADGHSRRRPTLSISEGVDRLGGKQRAFQEAALYVRFPSWLAPERTWAVHILGECGKRALPHVVNAMKDEDASVRGASASVLAVFGPEAVPYLVEALSDEDVAVRCKAAWSLERLGPAARKAVPALRAALKDGDALDPYVHGGPLFGPRATVCAAAARALGAIGAEAKEAVSSLEGLLKSDNRDVRQAAAAALKRIRDRKRLEKQAPPE